MANERVLRALLRLGLDKRSLKEVQDGLKSVEDALEDVADKSEKSGKQSAAGFGIIAGAVQAVTTKLIELGQRAVTVLAGMGKEAIAVGTQFEKLTTQFTTLLGGDQAGAQNLISQLQQFNIATPFELDQLAEGAKLLQTFGGEALNTAENWKLIGDAAASVNQPFERAAFWVGRLYSNLQAGRPFGEASMALQEMGIMSGEMRTKLEDMQKAGASSTEIWAAFNAEIGEKFAGGAERLAQTFTGIMSNLADFRTELLRVGGEEIFGGIKEDAQTVLDTLSDPAMSAALKELAEGFGSMAESVRGLATEPFLQTLQSIDPENLARAGGSLQDAGEALEKMVSAAGTDDFNAIIRFFTIFVDSATLGAQKMDDFNTKVVDTGKVFEFVAPAFESSPIFKLALEVKKLIDQLQVLDGVYTAITGKDLAEEFRQNADAVSSETEAQEALREQYEELNRARAAGIAKMQRAEEQAQADALKAEAEAAQEAAAASKEYADAVQKVNDALDEAKIRDTRQRLEAEIDLERELADLTEEFAQKRIEAERDYTQERIDITEDANQDRMEVERDYILDVLDAEADFAQQRIDLARDNANEISDIQRRAQERIADATRELSQATADINQDIAREMADVDRDLANERIDIETNYQREVQRIRQQFAFTAEEAVRNQDAIGFLRAKREQEQALQEAQQNRDQDIQDAQVAAERKREELRIQRERELEDERIANERKMEELRLQLQRELEEQRIQHEREMEQQRQEEARKLEQLAQAKERELQEVDQKAAQKLQAAAEEYSQEQALIDEQEAQKQAKLQENHDRELADLNRHYQQRQSDIRRNLDAEMQIINNYVARAQAALSQAVGVANIGGGIPGLQGGLPLVGGRLPGRASGGYANRGVYQLGERGQEFVLDAARTKQLEGAFGTLTQDKFSRLASATMNNTFNFSERDDARQIMSQVEQVVSRQLMRVERGY